MQITRRRLFLGAGAAAAASAVSWGGTSTAGATAHALTSVGAMPQPLRGTVPLDPTDPDTLNIHWALPGPEGATTQILGLPAFGLDVDASTITDFSGDVAYAVVPGEATDNSGTTHTVEFDVRVMQGNYKDDGGAEHYGTFVFL